jgi:GTPase SAR1 family protein
MGNEWSILFCYKYPFGCRSSPEYTNILRQNKISVVNFTMDSIFVTGTAGAGKSVLASRLLQWYSDNGSYPVSLNLDPGAETLPYEPDVDVRDYVDMKAIMEEYNLGPNGSLIIASDLISTHLEEIQNEVNELNPDVVVIDTPGQIELFAFRASGPYFVGNFLADYKVNIFVFDGTLVSSAINYVSISLLASSVMLRLKTSQVNVLSKSDLITDKLPQILGWASSSKKLEDSLNQEKEAEYSLLSKEVLRALTMGGFLQDLIVVSGLTMSGMINLVATIARIVSQGEDRKD